MDVSEGEPPLKRRHQKRTLVAESNIVCGLTHHQWFDLILQRLLLEDLIAVKRTCKTFAAFKRLRDRIKDKEYTAFGEIDKKHWNRMAYYRDLDDLAILGDETMKKYEGKCALYYDGPFDRVRNACPCYLGLFSNKKKMWNAFLQITEAAGGVLDEREYTICMTGIPNAEFDQIIKKYTEYI